MSTASEHALRITNLDKHFGGVSAASNVTMSVAAGSRHGLIGPNGAGKTTLFNMVCGVFPPDSGSIHFFGRDISHLADWQRSRLGIARTFQNLNLVDSLSLAENVAVGALARIAPGRGRASFAATKKSLRAESRVWDACMETIQALDLAGYAERLVGDLPGPVQRRAEIARCLVAKPTLLLLDEPVAGMTAAERSEIREALTSVSDETTILLVEHDVEFVMKFCETVTVLDEGAVITTGRPDDVRRDDRVIAAYIGA